MINQRVLPAIRHMKDFEKVLKIKHYEYIVLLDTHVARVKDMILLAKRSGKKVLLHADLIQGLKNDEHAAEFICQEIKPAGIVSTRSTILTIAKKRKLITVQRLFLLDSISLETSLRLYEKVKPDYIEILPGIIPKMIAEFKNELNIPIVAGGLIRTLTEVKQAIDAGASMVSTSQPVLWEQGKEI